MSLQVLMSRNKGKEYAVTPFLYIKLIRTGGTFLKEFPRSLPFSISLPIMIEGIISLNASKLRYHQFRMTQPEPGGSKYQRYTVFKVTLPTEYSSWTEFVYLDKLTPLKMKIKFDSVPEYEEVESEPLIDFTFDPAAKLYRGVKVVQDDTNRAGITFTQFYVGVTLPKEVPPGTDVTVSQRAFVNVCVSQNIEGANFMSETCVGIPHEKLGTVMCKCTKFGQIFARSLSVRRTRLFLEPIVYEAPEETAHDEIDSIPVILLVIVLCTMLGAFFLDRRRHKMNMIYPTAYPGDNNLLIIGIFTSVRFLAGTRSAVAMKIVGVESSSRVILLQTHKIQRLRMGQDDWFVVTTKRPLGKLTDIILWHDHYWLSDWHCSEIYIYDPMNIKWYHLKVDRWFGMVNCSEDDSKKMVLKVREIDSVEGVFLSLPYSFSAHFINELRNSHNIISLLYLRKRSLTTIEHRSYVILLKVLSLSFSAWIVEKYVTKLFFGKELDPEAARGLLGLDIETIFLSLIVLLISIPFVLPFQLAFRSNYKSRLLQKKITNPMYLQMSKPEDLVTTSAHPTKAVPEAEVTPTVKKVGFRLGGSESQSAARVTRLLSNVLLKRIAWTKTKRDNIGRSWKKTFLTYFGPAQFHCVNITWAIFEIKIRRRMMVIR
ncbi:hypothetical protein GE061_014870 [Apolygus lucorum]|uniref:Uncharacterized protein n=1 Tax=Apolygus lucorum TaxID=248454 RepID=A0A6A4JJN1_APOLU|nr:hypothetical protein GE061_014870 [Apolygus lucorum]